MWVNRYLRFEKLIDNSLVKIIAQRAECVKATASFKTNHSTVRAPERVEQIINKVRRKAAEAGLSEVIIEKVFRAMIEAFINNELEQHDQLK